MKKSSSQQRVFITGGAGFIGANLTRYLLRKHNCDVTVYDNLSTGSRANLDKATADLGQDGRIRFIEADILDLDTLTEAAAGHDAVIHLAAHTRVRESIRTPQQHLMVNSVGTFNAIEAARRQNVGIFILASSNAAVGEQIPPINETMIARPLSPYGAVKLYGEALCSAYYNCYGLKTVALRFANAYGPYADHKTSVISKFLKLVKQGQGLEIYGDGNQTRDFIHAADIAQAIYRLVTFQDAEAEPWGEIFQIATGKETSIIHLAEMITSLAGSNPKSLSFASAIKGEIRKNFSDITKAKDILGFSPKMNLQTQLKALYAAGD